MATSPHILLVDDDPIMRELAEAKLSEAGYNVSLAENGEIALKMLADCQFDLVISDIEMPVMNGFELTRNIRQDRTISATPLIMITASDHPEAVDRAFAEGATSFLAKPINWTLFNQAVKFVLRASQDQQHLREARDQAEAGAKFKDALMSVMSHELRTPLNAIIGFGQLLGEQFEKQDDQILKEYADYIVGGGRRLLSTVSDMLLASDARSGPLSLNENDATVSEIVDGARDLASGVSGVEKARFNIRMQDPEQEICCDRTLMSRALFKLIDNALKFSPAGVEITIGTAVSKSGDLVFLIKDNGPGVDPEKLKDMTSPFAQSDMSLKRSKEGLGLGLPMAKAIAAAHKAQFRLESSPGDGVRAFIVMPKDRVTERRRSEQNAA